ncbi:MAG: hypothetical protein A2172_03880 [Candidatus Woykebacteria bacterium RBG_13_40_15]|uniref:Uncharacterized protein n=1 Tax=Candidatus Woykebacteria bacterium RBG_13_40_15 TaxID=1802593 RepID=A0A1G1WA88_9BACT|nr:MAG: hypothetical protein A2172_03880 [Candidatus Woykebacteria bacterium RBG_13_40_15]
MTKLGKEVWLVVAAVMFLLSYLIDRLAGPVNISVKAPIAFLTSSFMLRTYPFTAAAIIIRSLAIFVSSMLIISLFERKYFSKAIFLLLAGVLAEFFALQQLATGFRVTTIQWTLSIAYGSLTLVLGIAWLILKGIWALLGGKEVPESSTRSTTEEKSVLEPPKEENS